jgi:plasmid replication initiation protein
MSKPVDQHVVAKSNKLIQASYKLTLNEQRLILLAVAGLNSKRPATRPGFNQVDAIRITAQEFGEAWNLNAKDSYSALKDATNDLYERSINEIAGKRTVKMRWVSRVEYHDGEGWAELSLSPYITPHLTNLGREFTEYRLGQVANLRSTYAIRLFEWCIQFSRTGWLQVSLAELTQRLGVAYALYNDIRRYVVKPAVEELRAKSNLEIDFEPIKDGRKVTAIRFTFRLNAQGKLEL